MTTFFLLVASEGSLYFRKLVDCSDGMKCISMSWNLMPDHLLENAPKHEVIVD